MVIGLTDLCTLPKASGLCEDTLPRWYYDYSETRCMPFYYTGCDGNANRFITRGECDATCPGDIEGNGFCDLNLTDTTFDFVNLYLCMNVCFNV